MDIENLSNFNPDSKFETDLAIIGGGPAGLTVAREFFGTSVRVLVIESGLLDETQEHAALAAVESIGEPQTELQKQKRVAFHGASSPIWSQDQQPYGVRCRALGGSSHAWAGKSAAFDPIDFASRSWVKSSGWPIKREDLDPYLDRAAHALNLGPNCYNDSLWKLIGIKAPEPSLEASGLRSFFWQFARDRIDQLDIMRFGREFASLRADNVRVLLNATVRQIKLTPDGSSFIGLDIATIDGMRSEVRANVAVVAASGIENPRLLLASNAVHSSGIGNTHDLVGRYLMDHAGARVARFEPRGVAPIMRRFGFYGLRHCGRTHMYMHGLAVSPEVQEREQLLNSAVYFMPERALDDPWDALKRLLQRRSPNPLTDGLAVFRGSGLVAKGIGMKALTSSGMPDFLKRFIVDTAIRYRANMAAGEFQSRGLPHKLTGLWIDAITEQRPNPDSRISLSDRSDRLGVPLAKVDWRINDEERRTLARVAELVCEAFPSVGLPQPLLESWVAERRLADAIIIDMAHTLGTTRMSENPRLGVVDENCKVHGVGGLYVAGGSIFPTSGHANPTLMILALAIRLADRIKSEHFQVSRPAA
jgi:choline dehydrogenase-like flavoprotein